MRSVWLFFAVAVGGVWALQLPAWLGAQGFLPGGLSPYMLPAALDGERTRGSLLAAVLAHAGVHLDNLTHALPAQLTAYAVFTAAVCVAAAVITSLKLSGRAGASTP